MYAFAILVSSVSVGEFSSSLKESVKELMILVVIKLPLKHPALPLHFLCSYLTNLIGVSECIGIQANLQTHSSLWPKDKCLKVAVCVFGTKMC